MADLPITSDEGAQPIVINDPVTTANIANVTSAGALRVTTNDNLLQTYKACVLDLVTAALATDIFTISGSATKIIKLRDLQITGLQSLASTVDILIVKRSTADSGGTSTTITGIPVNSNNAAATAVVKAYTANPTLGALVGNIIATKVFISDNSKSFTAPSDKSFLDVNSLWQPIILNNNNETIAINLNGVTITGSSIDISIIWTEE
jgi:hypothetical protein